MFEGGGAGAGEVEGGDEDGGAGADGGIDFSSSESHPSKPSSSPLESEYSLSELSFKYQPDSSSFPSLFSLRKSVLFGVSKSSFLCFE